MVYLDVEDNGMPGNVSTYLYMLATRLSDLGGFDYCDQPVMGSTRKDSDSLKRDRMHRIIVSYPSSD